MRQSGRAPRRFVLAALVVCAGGPALAVDPGVDIAAPRVAISTVDAATIQFHPASLVIEQNDHVLWRWTGGLHNTTSQGAALCTASGLWNSALTSAVTSFQRRFTEPPSTINFFCQPHCGIGMRGSILITTPIAVTATPGALNALQLAWTGGGGLYRIYRSTSPLFTGGTTTVLTGANGLNAAAFSDSTGGTPAVGTAQFYLVMNHF